jgi:murein hydrolase activator
VRQVDPRRIVGVALIAATFGMSAFSASTQEIDPTAEQLREVEKNLEQSRAERNTVTSRTDQVKRDLVAVRKDMIATAKDIQDQEHSLTVLESRIKTLESEAKSLTTTLGRRDKQMNRVLLALERLALRPQDALTLHPLAPDDAVRSAILLRAAVPHIKNSASELQTELAGLYRVRREIVEQKERAAIGAAELLSKRRRLEALAREKETQQAALVSQRASLDRRVAKMAREAQNLRELFERLAEEKERREAEERARQIKERELAAERAAAEKRAQPPSTQERIILKPPPGMKNSQPDIDEIQTASLPPDPGNNAEVAARQARLREQVVTRSFAKARGTMPFPVAGNLTEVYGAATTATEAGSLRARGITIQGRSAAQVVAPFDGIVAFAGPFRGYGRLLIIEHSEGYHTLLAGLGRIDSAVGQLVLAGEPVGVMENSSTTSLYVELRRNGQPVNPLPWLASRSDKSSG